MGNSKIIFKLSALAVGMFIFALYGLPPLYNAFCEWTGLNGKGGLVAAEDVPTRVVEDRQVRVTFIATNNENMPWEFKPNDPVMIVKPGEVANTTFFAKNTTDRDMVSRAIPSFVPSTAADYFKKTQCFCFDNQPLAAGESADMGIQFYVDPDLPKSITNITLSYTIFDITEATTKAELSQR
jgi:cytochrome c oxidase assembly protein subunit 11